MCATGPLTNVAVALLEDPDFARRVRKLVFMGGAAQVPGKRMLAVAPQARGRGAGEALVRVCVERTRAVEGCDGVVLSTQRSVHAAHRVYERLGFTRTPERDWNPLPDLLDVMLSTYELTL